jgi:hypothetical protein
MWVARLTGEGVVASSFAQQVALELDRVRLRDNGIAPDRRDALNTSRIIWRWNRVVRIGTTSD